MFTWPVLNASRSLPFICWPVGPQGFSSVASCVRSSHLLLFNTTTFDLSHALARRAFAACTFGPDMLLELMTMVCRGSVQGTNVAAASVLRGQMSTDLTKCTQTLLLHPTMEAGMEQLSLAGDAVQDVPTLAELAGQGAAYNVSPTAVQHTQTPLHCPGWRRQAMPAATAAGNLPPAVPPAARPPTACCPRIMPVQDWAALPHSLLGDIFRRLLEQHTALEDIVKAWQVGGRGRAAVRAASRQRTPRGLEAPTQYPTALTHCCAALT